MRSTGTAVKIQGNSLDLLDLDVSGNDAAFDPTLIVSAKNAEGALWREDGKKSKEG